MQKITSFTIDHLKLQPGVYVSRKDPVGNSLITTFDIRMTSPNEEPVMNTAEMHAIEHLGATFLRNHPAYGSRIIYFGPMGCITGFYFLVRDFQRQVVHSYDTIFKVPKKYKKEILEDLDSLNINMKTIYGDFDNIARYLNSKKTNEPAEGEVRVKHLRY